MSSAGAPAPASPRTALPREPESFPGPDGWPAGSSSPHRPRTSNRGSRSRQYAQGREEVVGGQVLEGIEAFAECPYVVEVGEEGRDRLSQAEVAGGPRTRPREMGGEEPVRRPLADPRQCDEALLDLCVVEQAQSVEIDLRAGERDDILSFTAREPEGEDLVRIRERELERPRGSRRSAHAGPPVLAGTVPGP